MSFPLPSEKLFQELARRRLHGMSAATKATTVAALEREINNRKGVQDELDDIRRQNYALSDLLDDYEELLPELEAQIRAYEDEIKESREEVRKGKQREDAADEYTKLLEIHCEELENACSRAVAGSACRERDLRMELDAENLRAQELEHTLHLQEERTRRFIQWQMQNLRAEYNVNEALSQYTDETEQRLSRLKCSQKRSRHNANRIQKAAARLAHQGEYNLAGQSSVRKAKLRKRRQRSSINTDSDNSMADYIESAELMDVDEVVKRSPHPPMMARLKIQEILKLFHKSLETRKVRNMANLNSRNDAPKPESPVRQIDPVWGQHRKASADLGTESSGSEGSHIFPIPPRKKRTRRLNLDEEINQSPKRQRSSAEAPELRPKMQRLAIDETKATPTSQNGLVRLIRPRVSRWAPFKEGLTNKRRDPQPRNLTPIRRSDVPPMLAAPEQRRRLDARGRSLSLNDLPQLPSGQMPGSWPPDALGDIDLVSQCQRAWREIIDWVLQLFWRQPSTVFVSVGLAAMAWVWHCHRVQEDWMTANEIPYGIASELRNAHVSEVRWVESLVFSFTKWLDMDRSMLG